MTPGLKHSDGMEMAHGDLTDDDLEDGMKVEIVDGDLKGKRGTVIGWVTAGSKKVHGVNKGNAGMVTVLIGPHKDKNGKDGYMFFKQAALRKAAKVDLEGTIANRDSAIMNDEYNGCGDEKIPPLKTGKNVMEVLRAGQANVLIESMLALKDQQNMWNSVKARGDTQGSHALNAHVSFSTASEDSSFVRSDVSLSKPFSEVKVHVEQGMESVQEWDPNIIIRRVVKELPISETEKRAGVTSVACSYVKLNTRGIDALAGDRQINLLEVVMAPPGRDLVAALYVSCNFPGCPSEGTSKVPGTAVIWAQGEGGASVAGYIGCSNQLVGWRDVLDPEEIILKCPLPTACIRCKVEGEGNPNPPACCFGLFGC